MKSKRWTREERRHWTREQARKGMYIIPSLFTVSNIFCGFYSISSSIRGNYELAGILIGIAMILDTLDGRLARMTHTTSDFGVQLDSLADVITFGIAPAVLCYQWAFYNYEKHIIDRAGWLACFLFVVCAASRLARFNVQSTVVHDKRYFIGLPTPPAAGVVAATIYCFPERLTGDMPAVIALILMLVIAFLMVSRIRYRTFKDLNLREPRSYRITVVIALIIFFMALDLKRALITLATLYAISGPIAFILNRRKKRPGETTEPSSAPSNP
jgi:CDP-diacylglycerol--serine O-phosphatidyltransferase